MSEERDQAERFAELFRAVYLTFHRRDGPRSQLPGASRAVLEHLAMAGPLTIGEAAAHLRRAQSVVSEIVSHLEDQGLLERESRPGRPAAHADLAHPGRPRRAAPGPRGARPGPARHARSPRCRPGQADALIGGLQALVHAADPPPDPNAKEVHP